MAIFPSDEWLSLFKDEVNKSEAYRNLSKKWEGSFIFTVEAEGGFTQTARMYVDLWHGTCREARQLRPDENVEATYVWAGKYHDWVALLKGTYKASAMVVSGKFRVKGNANRLLSGFSPAAADELVEAAKRVDTTYYDLAATPGPQA